MKPTLLLALLLCSCDYVGKIHSDIPIQTEVFSSAKKVDGGVQGVSSGNQKIKEQNTTLKDAAKEAREQADLATKQAEALAQSGKATQEQLDEVWKSMKATQARNLFLETQINIQEKLVEDQKAKIDALISDSKELSNKAFVSDTQAKTIRDQYETLNRAYEDTLKERDKYKSTADSASVYRNWVWILVGGYVIISIIIPMLLANARKVVNPLS